MPHRDRLRRLHDVSVQMLGTLDLDRLYDSIVGAATALDTVDAAALMLMDPVERALSIRASRGLSPQYASAQRLPAERLRYRGPDDEVVVDFLRQPPRGNPELIRKEGLTKVLALPIVIDGKVEGALHLYTKEGRPDFDEQDRELAHILAAQATVAITNARLFTELQDLEREREEFLSIVSHELRTPLTPLKALAQLQLARLKKAKAAGEPVDVDGLLRNLQSIERQVDRMNGLVSDLLSVSRAGRGGLQMERAPIDLAELTRDVVERYVTATREEGRHRFSVDAPESLVVPADQARVDQLLMNLVGNAVKYSPRGGEVAVSLVQKDGVAEIAIRDHGIGIPAEDMPRLGGAFTRGGGRAGTFAGMGIGLHIAKLVAEGHGGTLTLESAGEDQGTTVRVRLPL